MKHKYYSQWGEDKWMVENCELPEKGVFVDVGAGGIENSNSYYFEKKGWKVLCIEPDTRHIGLEKRQLVDNSVVGDEEKEVNFVFHRFPSLSGLFHSQETAVKLKMYKLDTILEKYNIQNMDILSIDVEGNEDAVLAGFNIKKYKPTYIIIEHTNQFKGNRGKFLTDLLESEGYDLKLATASNLILQYKGLSNSI